MRMVFEGLRKLEKVCNQEKKRKKKRLNAGFSYLEFESVLPASSDLSSSYILLLSGSPHSHQSSFWPFLQDSVSVPSLPVASCLSLLRSSHRHLMLLSNYHLRRRHMATVLVEPEQAGVWWWRGLTPPAAVAPSAAGSLLFSQLLTSECQEH